MTVSSYWYVWGVEIQFRHGWIKIFKWGHQDFDFSSLLPFSTSAAVWKTHLLGKLVETGKSIISQIRVCPKPIVQTQVTHITLSGLSVPRLWNEDHQVLSVLLLQDFCENQWGCGTGTVLSMVTEDCRAHQLGQGLCISEAWQLGLQATECGSQVYEWIRVGQSCVVSDSSAIN